MELVAGRHDLREAEGDLNLFNLPPPSDPNRLKKKEKKEKNNLQKSVRIKYNMMSSKSHCALIRNTHFSANQS